MVSSLLLSFWLFAVRVSHLYWCLVPVTTCGCSNEWLSVIILLSLTCSFQLYLNWITGATKSIANSKFELYIHFLQHLSLGSHWLLKCENFSPSLNFGRKPWQSITTRFTLNRPLFPTWSPGTTEYWWVYYNYNMFSILQVPRSKARWASSKKEERRRSVLSLRMVIGFRLNGCCCLSQIPGVVQQTDPMNKQPTVPVDMLCWRHVSRAFHTPVRHNIRTKMQTTVTNWWLMARCPVWPSVLLPWEATTEESLVCGHAFKLQINNPVHLSDRSLISVLTCFWGLDSKPVYLFGWVGCHLRLSSSVVMLASSWIHGSY